MAHVAGDPGFVAWANGVDSALAATQPLDADLTAIGALDATIAGALATDGAGWVRKTYAQLKTALGLGNVDNTADTAKPVSTAQQTALNLKADASALATTNANVATNTTNITANASAITSEAATARAAEATKSPAPTTAVAAWAATTSYPTVGQLVTNGGYFWSNKVAHTSGASFSGATNWVQLAPVLGTADGSAPLAVTAASGTFVTVVEHGATAGTARPAGAARVFWRGTVTPTNAVVGDRYVNYTTPSAPTESICTSVGPVVFASLGGAAGALIAANNLSDLANAPTARSNLGLGTAATQSSAAFDGAGAATTAQAAAVQRANHTGTQPASTITGLVVASLTDNQILARADDARLRSDRALRGFPVGRGGFVMDQVAQVAAVAGTSRTPLPVLVDCCDLRLLYANVVVGSGSAESDTLNPSLSYNVALEIAGTIYPLTVNGNRTFTVDQGGVVITDPLGVEVSAGTTIFARTYVSGATAPYRTVSNYAAVSGGGGFVSTTNSAYSGTINDAGGAQHGPTGLLGTPADHTKPCVAILGDSIVCSEQGNVHASSATTRFSGYLERALATANAGFLNLATSGDYAQLFASNHRRRSAIIAGVTHALCNYGSNDIYAGSRTLAQVQADLITIWVACSRRGAKTFQATITPRTTSTDGWATLAGQTITTGNAVRLTVNAWIRDGSPLNPTTLAAQAVGTATSATCVRAGVTGHPLSAAGVSGPSSLGYFEAANLVETAQDSGYWITNGRQVSDGAIATGTSTFTSATAAFVVGDVGTGIVVNGAGSAGAQFSTTIASRTNATTVVLAANASTTVAAAVTGIGANYYTLDGIHPSTAGATAIAPSVNISTLVF